MLWIVPMVNNASIGYCEVQRIEPVGHGEPAPDTMCRYRYLLQLDRRTPEGTVVGEVEHRYGDGAWALLGKVLRQEGT